MGYARTLADVAGKKVGALAARYAKRLAEYDRVQHLAARATGVALQVGGAAYRYSHLPAAALTTLAAGERLALAREIFEGLSPDQSLRILALAREAGGSPAERLDRARSLADIVRGATRVHSAHKTYDIRGNKLTAGDVFWFARAFAEEFQPGDTMVVGHDIRSVTQFQSPAIVEALRQAGLNVIDVGEVGTGLLKWESLRAYLRGEAKGGIQNTGSHTVPHTVCGLKEVKNGRPFSRSQIVRQREIEKTMSFRPRTAQRGSYENRHDAVMSDYQEFLRYVTLRTMGHSNIDIVGILADPARLAQTLSGANYYFDAGFGAMGPEIIEVLESLGVNVRVENVEPNGERMAEHILDPNEREEVDRLAGPLLHAANIADEKPSREGVIMDPDRDRGDLMYADGTTIPAGEFLMILASQMAKNPDLLGTKVVLDVRAPVALRAILEKLGLEFVVSAAGYSFVLDEMEKGTVRFGSEMTLHTMTTWTAEYMRFKGEEITVEPEIADYLGIDDAPTSILMAMAILAKEGKTAQQLVDDLYLKYVLARTMDSPPRIKLVEDDRKFAIASAVDIRFRNPDVINRILLAAAPTGYQVTDEVETIDGSKILIRDLDDNLVGSFLTRVSNTGPQNCLVIEAIDSPQGEDFATHMLNVWTLENLLATQQQGVDVNEVLDGGKPGARAPQTTYDMDYAALFALANQYDDYASLRSVLETRVTS